MAKSVLESKSLMLVPICDGDQVAAAILDYVYLFFQQPNPYEIFFRELRRGNRDASTDDFYQYIQESHGLFNLNIEDDPNSWLLTSLTELHAAIGGRRNWGNVFSIRDIFTALRILDNKRYMSIEYWQLSDLSEKEVEASLQAKHHDMADSQLSCWLHRERVDYAVAKYYSDHLVMPPIDEHIDLKKRKTYCEQSGASRETYRASCITHL